MVYRMKLKAFGKTDQGLIREKNEDALYVDEERHVYAVADGLGGLPRGAEASELAISILEQLVETTDLRNGRFDFPKIYAEINQRVYKEGRQFGTDIGMGTTLTSVRVSGEVMSIAHVGDSALYRFRNGEAEQITVDHTMEQEIRDRLRPGEDAYIPEYFSHTLTRCIGQAEDIQIDLCQLDIEPGDRFLICSDGVTKTIQHHELGRLVKEYPDPDRFVEGVIILANNRGGPDNITAIALFFD